MIDLKNLKNNSFLQLKVFDKNTKKIIEVRVYRNSSGGGDLDIDNALFEHYEDYDELRDFFYLRFREVTKRE